MCWPRMFWVYPMREAVLTDGDALAMLRSGARDWVSGEHPLTLDHEEARAGSRLRWRAMAELGWTGMMVPEAQGGLGLGMAAYCAVAEELGRELAVSPMLSTGLLAPALLEERSDLLQAIVAGEVIVALATEEGAHHGAPVRATAAAAQGGWQVVAAKRYVPDAPDADWFLLTAQTREGVALFLVPCVAVRVQPLDMIDGRSMGHVTIDGPAVRLAVDADCLTQVLDRARLGLAAEMLGAASQAFEIILDFLKTREQFGRLIGCFQGLQHRAAQMLVDLELARACVSHGCMLADVNDPDFAEAAGLAKFMAGEALHRVSNEMVQMHGGIGMTAEHPAGRYLRWARVSEMLLGDAGWLAGRHADLNGY